MHSSIATSRVGGVPRILARTVTIAVVAALVAATGTAAHADDRTTTATASVEPGTLTVDVAGTGYEADLPNSSTGPAAGVYVALIDEGAEASSVGMGSASYDAAFVANAALSEGLSATLTASASTLPAESDFEVLVWSAHGVANDDTTVARVPVEITDTQRAELFSAAPTVAGIAMPGETLTATVTGAWAELFDLTYQWFANGVAIDDADELTLALTTAQLDKTITFAATATPEEGDPFTATSNPTARVSRETTATVASVTSGLVVHVAGADYLAPLPPGTATQSGLYAAVIDANAELADITMGSGGLGTIFVPNVALAGGLNSNLAAIPASSLQVDGDYDVLIWSAHGNPTADTVLARVPLTITDAQRAELFAGLPTIAGNAMTGEELTAAPGGTWGEAFEIEYQWFADGVAIAGADEDILDLDTAQLGKAITVTTTVHPVDGAAVARTSAATGLVTRGTWIAVTNTANGLTLTVTGRDYNTGLPLPTNGEPPAGVYVALVLSTTPSTSVTSLNNNLDAEYRTNTQNATSLTTVLSTPATLLSASANYDILIWSARGNPTATTVITRMPVTLSADQRAQMVATTPTVTGTLQVGRTLTASAGTWANSATLTYQWLADGAEISGATGSTFVPTKAQLGAKISVTATSIGDHPVSRTSAQTAAIGRKTAVAVLNTTQGLTLLVSGQDYTTLPNASSGQPAAGVYAVLIDAGTNISAVTIGASQDGATFVPLASVIDGDFVAGLTASPARLQAASNYEVIVWSAHGSPTASNLLARIPVTLTAAQRSGMVATTPTIVGSAQVGAPLSVSTGTWATDDTAFTYQWLVDGSPVTGATNATYVPTDAAIGKVISVTVTGTPAGGVATSRTSAPTSTVPGVLVAGTPAITGTAQVGSTLTATAGTWTDGTTVTFEWLRDGAVINGATAATYTLTLADQGALITVRVVGSKVNFATASALSQPTTAVLGNLTDTPVPTISGTAQVGKVLTASAGTWDAGTTLTYQWYANGATISGATAATYTPTSGAYAKVITVKVTGTKAGYATVAKTSAGTATVKLGTLVKAPTPTISGTAKVGYKLTAKVGTWDTGVTKTYQWYASGKAIKGATKSTYTISKSYKGKTITVKVTGKKSGYTSVAKTSKATAKVR
ncbi:beta strand repeat-containing protein [Demequina sp.]|uniref:beta strand repeat-containing protein n=1 Tax=Demequina sp. TaxID=2050685 RepID=UPI003D10FDFB